MSILGKYTDNLIENEEQDTNGYKIPVVIKPVPEDSLKKSIIISTILHPTVIGLIALISFVLTFFGIISLVKKPDLKTKDIEFVLVDHEDTPINKKTPYRADINSRAGGHHDPTKKVSMPSPAPSPAVKPKASQGSEAPKKAQKTVSQPKPSMLDKVVKKVQTPPKQETPAAPKTKEIARPNPPTAKPSIKPPMTPKPVAKPTSPFQAPVPSGGTTAGRYATGPISGSGKAANGGSTVGGSSSGSGRYTPAPVLAPTGKGSGAGTGSGTGSKLGRAGGTGTGGYGNPGPGNPNGRPGIDAIREPDFGPYMRELQRRIKLNWNPPKGNESKRVVLLFKIAKDGRLLTCSVYKSSGLPNADKAALDAVKLTAPFKPLPAEFKGQSIDIQFTFDYNVFGATGY